MYMSQPGIMHPPFNQTGFPFSTIVSSARFQFISLYEGLFKKAFLKPSDNQVTKKVHELYQRLFVILNLFSVIPIVSRSLHPP